MPDISQDLQKILSSRYGKDVRQSIHDSISDINDVAVEYMEGANTARDQAVEAKNLAVDAKTSAETSATSANNAKVECQRIERDLGNAVIYMGTLTYDEWQATIASITLKTGYMWNISTDFTTTADFKEGAGIECKAGTNVARTNDGYWDLFGGAGGGNADIEELTQAEYDALPDSKLTDGVVRMIKDSGDNVFAPIEVTRAQYDALTEAQQKANVYLITDEDSEVDASVIPYDEGVSVKTKLDGLSNSLANLTPYTKEVTLTSDANGNYIFSTMNNRYENVPIVAYSPNGAGFTCSWSSTFNCWYIITTYKSTSKTFSLIILPKAILKS